MRFRILSLALMVAFAFTPIQLRAQQPKAVEAGSRVAIVGDSITEQKLYSKFMEAYLLACSGVSDVHVFQFGWGGEQASGFAARAENDLAVFNPTVATLCYGMNDGGYQPYKEEIGTRYENNMRNVLAKLEKLNLKTVVVGSPGAVDTYFFRPNQMMGDTPAHVAYNDNLAHLRDIDRALATEKKLLFADVHGAMYDAMQKAHAALGKEYDVCGRDGFHPGNNGQLLMAYAFLKGLGLDGSIGEVTVDLKGKSTASAGHTIVNGSGGKLEIESTRWPFCFQGDDKSSNGTRSILPFTSFNNDLNRLIVKVKGLESPHAIVKWGNAEKKFTRDQLAAGVNLADAFAETPFDANFQKLLDSIAKKQAFETYIIKSLITNFRSIPGEFANEPELKKAFEDLRNSLAARHRQLDSDVHACLVPVKHSLQVTASE